MFRGKKDIVRTDGDTIVKVKSGPQIVSANTTVTSGSNELDIVYVVDTTGSMHDVINALLEACREFVDEPKKLGFEPAFGVVAFGDLEVQGGGDTVKTVVPMTTDLQKVKAGLSHMPDNDGFGNYGESCLEGVHEALGLKFRPKAIKVIVLFTDDGAHQSRYSVAGTIRELKSREFLTFVVSTPREEYYKQIAKETGGEWMEIRKGNDLNALRDLLSRLAQRVTKVSQDVKKIGGGSVQKYLQLKGGSR
jgi:Mg-chelatase subunit ChlD